MMKGSLNRTSCATLRKPIIPSSRNYRPLRYLAKSALPTDDSLQRLESFFGDPPPGADPVPYAPRRHYRPARFTTPMNADQLVGEAPVVDQQAAASSSPTHSPAPVTLDTVADKLSSLTTEQLANLQNAVQQASSSLTELQSRASSQLSTLQEKVSASEPALAQLQDSVASLRHTAEEQLTHLYSSLTEVIGALKQNQATSQPLAPDIKPQQNVGGSRRKAPATKAVPEPEVAVRTRLQQDLQDGIAGMQQMTDAQLQNLQSALRMLQSELTERGQTLTAALQRGQATTAPAAQKTAAPARKQQRTAKLQEEKGVANVAVHNSLQDLGARGLENLRLAASAVRQAVSPLPQRLSESLRAPAINMPSLKTPSVGVPTLSIPTETAAAGLRGLLASHVWAWGIGVAIVILACIRWVSRRWQRRRPSEEDELLAERRREALNTQRSRLKQALSAGTVDTSVFSAVKKKGSSIERPSLAAEDDDEAGAGDVLANPEAWDAETRRAWEQFVKGSKLGEGEMWDAGKQDEGLPKVWVDLDKE